TDVRAPFPMTPLSEAMKTVSSIGIVMLGSLPMAELLQRLLKVPLTWLGKKTGMNSASMTGLLLGSVSVVPAIALIREMDRRGKIVNAAFLVCAASALAAHLGFTFGVQKEMVVPLLAVKFLGGLLGGAAAYGMTGKTK
ncbi:MAG: ethanolamine utilization protein EutH, partial [Blautia sp.]